MRCVRFDQVPLGPWLPHEQFVFRTVGFGRFVITSVSGTTVPGDGAEAPVTVSLTNTRIPRPAVLRG